MSRIGFVKLNQDGSLGKVAGKLNWYDDNGTPIVDDAVFIAGGWLPLYDEAPVINAKTERVRQLTKDHWTINADAVHVAYQVTAKALDEVIGETSETIDFLRDRGIFSGSVPWTRPSDNAVIPVDMRSQRDRDNIQDLRSAAMVLDSQGVTQAAMQFRGGDDAIYNLTPQDMIAMSQAMMQRGQAWYAAAWAHKDAIKALGTPEDVAAYDVTTGWPEA